MNREDRFESMVCSSLRSVSDRESLKNYYQSLIRSTENTDDRHQKIQNQIRCILDRPSNPIKGIDDQLIREKCYTLADQLEREPVNVSADPETELVERVLKQFRKNGFLTWILQKSNSKSKYSLDTLKDMVPDNEYDVQHLLFSLFRVLFDTCRTEVSQDDGYSTVRSDIYISEKTIIEVKSTARSSMSERDLIEEICSDTIRFDQKNHYFFVYDSRRLIKDRDQFESRYSENGSNPNKMVKIFICYPYY